MGKETFIKESLKMKKPLVSVKLILVPIFFIKAKSITDFLMAKEY